MKLFISFAVFLFSGIFSEIDTFPEVGSDNTLKVCDLPRESFHVNEEITYKIFYNASIFWLSVGEAKFTIKENKDHLILRAIGTTYESYDWIFPVRDTVTTILDKKTLRPIESTRIVHEGKYHRYDHMVFDYKTNTVKSLRGKYKNETELEVVDMKSCSKDILSTIYGLRGLDIDIFQTYKACNFDLFLDRKNFPINMNYLGVEKEKIKELGKQEVHVFNPELVKSKTFENTNDMRVYVSQDKNNLPLMIESPISVGKVKAILTDYKNLKHPVDFNK